MKMKKKTFSQCCLIAYLEFVIKNPIYHFSVTKMDVPKFRSGNMVWEYRFHFCDFKVHINKHTNRFSELKVHINKNTNKFSELNSM